MVVITPLVGGLITGGLSVMQGALGYQAQRQQYLNEVTYKKATDEFSRWSAGMRARVGNLNNQYAYWQQKINHGQEMAYANSVRNFELSNVIASAEEVFRARSSSGTNYLQGSEAIGQAFAQQAMADAVSMHQYNAQALQASAAVQAAAQEGRSTDRLINDYARQVGDMETLMEINQSFKDRQYTREQAGLIAKYLNEYNSQKVYEAQTVLDPIMPFAPLPTLIDPTPPSYVGAAPSATTAFLGTAINAVGQGFSTYNSLNAYTSSGRKD